MCFFNFYVETLKHAHGQYTPETIKRAGKIVGSLGKALNEVFQEKIGETECMRVTEKSLSTRKT